MFFPSSFHSFLQRMFAMCVVFSYVGLGKRGLLGSIAVVYVLHSMFDILNVEGMDYTKFNLLQIMLRFYKDRTLQ
jgi:hypothetical protein